LWIETAPISREPALPLAEELAFNKHPSTSIDLLNMADSEYTDDETEYGGPSHSQAVLMVSLALSSWDLV
jgi:hypothetical protein